MYLLSKKYWISNLIFLVVLLTAAFVANIALPLLSKTDQLRAADIGVVVGILAILIGGARLAYEAIFEGRSQLEKSAAPAKKG